MCYSQLLIDSEAPVLFPYGGFGTILVEGDRSPDGQAFFATRILFFRPGCPERRFRASLRRVDFYDDHAVYRDSRRKLKVCLDRSVMPIMWDATWDQWKHLLGVKIDVGATFMATGKYRHRSGEWELLKWERALPSRLEVKLPADIAEQVDAARKAHHRFGQFSVALEQIRARIETVPADFVCTEQIGSNRLPLADHAAALRRKHLRPARNPIPEPKGGTASSPSS